jgi:hypothetical protein
MAGRRFTRQGAFGVLAVATLVLFTSCAGPKKFNYGNADTGFILTYRGAKGDVLKYNITTEQTMFQEMMGQEMEIASAGTIEYSLKIDEVKPDGGLAMMLTFDKYEASGKGPQGEFSLEAEDLVGKTVGLVVGADGEVIERTGFDKLPEVRVGGQEIQLEQQFLAILGTLPTKPVKFGDTWEEVRTDTIIVAGGLQLQVDSKTTYTLVEESSAMDVKCLKVKGEGTFEISGKGNQGGAEVVFEGEGESTEEYYFDHKSGIMLSGTSQSSMEGTAAVSGPQNFTIPITQETKSSRTLIK